MTNLATTSTKTPLPDVSIRPGSDVVIFDGQCKFCTSQVQTLARLDRGKRLSFLSLHDPRVRNLCPDVSHENLMDQMYVLTPAGERFGGSDAVRYFTRRIPLLWPIAPLLHFPGSMRIWRALYRQIARRRYWFGRVNCNEGTCRLPG